MSFTPVQTEARYDNAQSKCGEYATVAPMNCGYYKAMLTVFTAGFILLALKLTILHFAELSEFHKTDNFRTAPSVVKAQHLGPENAYRIKAAHTRSAMGAMNSF